MKLFTGWVVSAGLVVMATAANAQGLAPHETGRSPYAAVSDIEGPYAAMPAEIPAPRYGPALLPPTEVYTILRESGFLPLGIPQQRGLVYTISVIDPAANRLLGVIRLGDPQPANLSPLYRGQLLVHGLGFSPDHRTLVVVSIGSNSVSFFTIGSKTRQLKFWISR